MVELYHWEPNGLFLKPLVALAEKQVAFTSHYFDPTSFTQHTGAVPQNTESRLQLEREGPLLVHEGEIISSTFFMLEYIAETFPGPDLLPSGAYERYQVRAWGQFLGLTLGAGVSALGCAKYLAPQLATRDAAELAREIERLEPQERRTAWLAVIEGTYTDDALAAIRERLKQPVKRVEDALSRDQWLAGGAYSIADIDAFAMLATLPDLAPGVVNERATPRIMEFLQRVRERPAVKESLALSRTGRPHEAFVPGIEPSRWG